MKREVVLLDKSFAVSKLRYLIKPDDLCYFLSKDYSSFLELNRSVPTNCKVLSLSQNLHMEITRIRKAYLELFGILSQKYSSNEWWGSQIASPNSNSTNLQLNITYLFCAKNIINDAVDSKRYNRIFFISESVALLDSLSRLAKERQFIIQRPRKIIYFLVANFKLRLIHLYRIFSFVMSSIINRRFAFSILNPIEQTNLINCNYIVFRSWITKGTLTNDEIYFDRNFGSLPEWMKSKGVKVLVLPMFFNLGKSLKSTLLLLKKKEISFLIPDHYLKLIDYLKVIYFAKKQIEIPLENISLYDTDLTLIFREILIQDGFNIGLLNNNLCYPLLKRLNALGIKVDKFYYPFENNAPEKLFILGCKKYFTDSILIAYQHSVWFKDQLGMFLGEYNKVYHPIAHKIISSSPGYIEILKNAGFPDKIIISGPNLRFISVYKSGSKLNQNIVKPNILIPLTFHDDLVFDIIHQVKIISLDFPDLFVYIRPHPLTNKQKLARFLKQINMVNFQYADLGTFQDWLVNTNLVITAGSSVAVLETVAQGIPLIRVRPSNYFFLDPLAWEDYPIEPVNNIEELKSAIQTIIGLSQDLESKLKTFREHILLNYFCEPSEMNLKIFLE